MVKKVLLTARRCRPPQALTGIRWTQNRPMMTILLADMVKATDADIGELVRVKLHDGTIYVGRLVYMDADWVDIATADDPGDRRRTLAPIEEVADISLLSNGSGPRD